MAYITKEEAKKARQIVNKIGKEYGFKFSVTMEYDSTLKVNLIKGRKITLNDLKISSLMKRFIEKRGLNDKSLLDAYGEVDHERFKSAIKEFTDGVQSWEYREAGGEYQVIIKLIHNGVGELRHLDKNGDIYKMFDKIENEVKKALGWHNNSNAMVDYFDTSFYYYAEIGKFDKPYVGIE